MYDEAHIRDWIRRLAVLRPELGGFAICPYASRASFKIIECPAKVSKDSEDSKERDSDITAAAAKLRQ